MDNIPKCLFFFNLFFMPLLKNLHKVYRNMGLFCEMKHFSDSLKVICLYMFLSVTVYRCAVVQDKNVTSKVFQCPAIPKTIMQSSSTNCWLHYQRWENKSCPNTWQRIWSVCEGLWYRIVPQTGSTSLRPVERIKVMLNLNLNFFKFSIYFSCLYKRNTIKHYSRKVNI